jgi:hypothetical protein
MRFLNISGLGIATDGDFCPNCHVLLDQREDYKACPLCRYGTRQHGQWRRNRRQRQRSAVALMNGESPPAALAKCERCRGAPSVSR